MASESGGKDNQRKKKVDKKLEDISRVTEDLEKLPLPQIIGLLRNEFLDGKNPVLDVSEINSDNVGKLFKFLTQKFLTGSVKFNKQGDVENIIKKILNSVIIPFLSLIIELNDSNILWDAVLILYKILSNQEKVLSEVESSDSVFRLAHGRVTLGKKVIVPIAEKYKPKMIEDAEKRLNSKGISDACYIFRRLSSSITINEYDRLKSAAYFYLLNEVFFHGYLKCNEGDYHWLVKDLWPPRIQFAVGDNKDEEIINGFAGERVLTKEMAGQVFSKGNSTLVVKWSDGFVDTFDERMWRRTSTRDKSPKERTSHSPILVELLLKEYNQLVKGEPTSWDSLVSAITAHKVEDGCQYEFYDLDLGHLFNLCYQKENKMALRIYQDIWRQDHEDRSSLSARFFASLENWSMLEILTKDFNIKSSKSAKEIFHQLVNKAKCEESIKRWWEVLLDHCDVFGFQHWEGLLKNNEDFMLKSLELYIEQLPEFILQLIKEKDKNEHRLEIVEWFLKTISVSDSFIQQSITSFLDKLPSEVRKDLSIGLLMHIMQKLLHALQDRKEKDELIALIQSYLLIIKSSLFTSGSSWLMRQGSDVETLKRYFSILMNTHDLLSRLLNKAAGSVAFECSIEILVNLEIDEGVEALKEIPNLKNIFVQSLLKQPHSKNTLEYVVSIVNKPVMKLWLEILLEELFKDLFHGNQEQCCDNLPVLFNKLTAILINGSQTLKNYFKAHVFDLVTGFSRDNIKESCVTSAIFIMDINQSQKLKLENRLLGYQHQPTRKTRVSRGSFTGSPVDVLQEYALILNNESNVYAKKEFSEGSCREEVKTLKEKFNKNAIEMTHHAIPIRQKQHCSNSVKEHLVDGSPLIQIKSMKDNLNLIMSAVSNPVNLLLEGPTGVGKTSLIMEAARLCGAPLIRFNMSSSTSIAAIFGSSFPENVDGKLGVNFQEGPFTKAFRQGIWLLLDEFNLAPDNVLSSIENALDTSRLMIPTDSLEAKDESYDEKKYIEYLRHKDFRLFCTQNPNAGLFKGKREDHSSSLLSRFSPVMISGPTINEMEEIISQKLIPFHEDEPRLTIDEKIVKMISNTHFEIQKYLNSCETEKHYAYTEVTLRDLMKWVDRIKMNSAIDINMEHAAFAAWSIYGARLRELSSQEVVKEIIKNNISFWEEDSNLKITAEKFTEIEKHSKIAVTREMKKCWRYILDALEMRHPILITGKSGCGKSELIRSLGVLLNKKLIQLYITPETEPEALVGHFVPEGKAIAWKEGIITKAVKDGSWVILENLSEAQSTVLERLNSVLENPPHWTVTENLQEKENTEKVFVHENFRIIATMTPPCNKKSERLAGANIITNSELSPALYNRFTIVNMNSQLNDSKSMTQIFRTLAQGTSLGKSESKFVPMFISLRTNNNNRNALSMHHFVRTIHTSVKLIKTLGNTSTENDALYTGIALHLLSTFKGEKYEDQEKIVKEFYPSFFYCPHNFSYLFEVFSTDKPYLIHKEQSPTQYEIACTLSLAIKCDFPCLLEGPAATGKSSLVKYLADCNNIKLEQINNTESTTISDYVGCIMPDGSYAKGPLVRAMENGSFFLADEFDLAEPAVLNMLYPILEGRKSIMLPDTNEIVIAEDSFRFFATQNGSSYAGRKELSHSLRSRFTEVYFEEFTDQEIKCIILKRAQFLTDSVVRSNVENNAEKLAEAYMLLNQLDENGQSFFQDGMKVTLREIVKWIKRKSLFPDSRWGLLGYELFYTRIEEKRKRNELASLMWQIFRDGSISSDGSIDSDKYRPNIVVDKEKNRLININHLEESLTYTVSLSEEKWEEIQLSTPSFKESLWNICIAAACEEPILLIGPTSYKSHLISLWCDMNQREDVETVLCNEASDSADLLGRLRPYSDMECLKLACITSHQFIACYNNQLDKGELRSSEMFQLLNGKIEEICKHAQILKEIIDELEGTDEQTNIENLVQSSSRISAVSTAESLSSEGSETYELFELNKRSPKYYGYTAPVEKCVIGDSSDSESDSEDDSNPDVVKQNEDINATYGNNISEEYDNPAKYEEEINVIGGSDDDEDSLPLSTDDMLDNLQSVQELEESPTIKQYKCFLKIISSMKETMDEFVSTCEAYLQNREQVKVLDVVYKCFCSVCREIEQVLDNFGFSHVSFMYQDGPCSKAVKEGSVLILRDINLPSQAVTERLNTILDVERSFSLNENLTLRNSDGMLTEQQIVDIPETLIIFATVHTDNSKRRKMNLSPAIHSRMTEIKIYSYNLEELIDLFLNPHFNMLHSLRSQMKDILSFLQRYISLTSRDMLMLKNFVLNQTTRARNQKENEHFYSVLVLGIIYLWVDRIPLDYADISHPYKYVLQKFGFGFENENEITKYGFDKDLISAIEGRDLLDQKTLFIVQKDKALLEHTPLVCSYNSKVDSHIPPDFVISKSTFKNICRVFAASESGLNLLLNGPPGIGKTKIIQHLADMLGFKCLRVNFSSNTTYEDLIGSFIPKVVGGKRTFIFVEGTLLRALRSSDTTWILLDEINLAHPTVLQKLMPIFSSSKYFRIDATGEVINLGKLHLFATKNPEIIGGGRNKLSESVLSKFTTIYLSEFTEEEFRKIGSFKLYNAVKTCSFPESFIEPMLNFHVAVSKMVTADSYLVGRKTFNLRDLEKFVLIYEKTSEFKRMSLLGSDLTSNEFDRDEEELNIEEICQ